MIEELVCSGIGERLEMGPGKSADKLLFFYTGGGARRIRNKGIPMSIGLATIGQDRFAGLAHWRNVPAGRVVTKPLMIPHAHLAVNIEYSELTPMRMAITTPAGDPLPGFGFDDSQIDLQIDHLYAWARWRNKSDLSELVGKQVQLHFEVNGAVLYAYRFVPQRKRG